MTDSTKGEVIKFIPKDIPRRVWIDYGGAEDDVMLFFYEVAGAIEYSVKEKAA